jgi:RNA dependent RNA polymerase
MLSASSHLLMTCSTDRLGVLKEGEIYFKPSSNQLRGPDGRTVNEVLGDVLITRNPCKLPTDVQKVQLDRFRLAFCPQSDRPLDDSGLST